MQAGTLTKRSFINMSRDFGYYWLRLLIYLLVTVCIGTIYYDVGTKYTSIHAVICLTARVKDWKPAVEANGLVRQSSSWNEILEYHSQASTTRRNTIEGTVGLSQMTL